MSAFTEFPEAVVQELLDRVLTTGLDGVGPLDSAQTVADAALDATHDRAGAIEQIMSDHVRLAAAEGFVTGLGGFVTMPIALPANLVAFYVLATRMVGAIAAVRGHDLSQDQTRTAVLLVLSEDDAPSILKKAGVVGSAGRLTKFALKDLPPATLVAVNKGVAFRLLVHMGEKGLARFGRFVPGVGGVIGGGLDAWLMRRLGKRAAEELLLDA